MELRLPGEADEKVTRTGVTQKNALNEREHLCSEGSAGDSRLVEIRNLFYNAR